ncbi:MAG: hypothetical protein QW279_10915, partial [Candidatus Jordarchaeaceae archaeon]
LQRVLTKHHRSYRWDEYKQGSRMAERVGLKQLHEYKKTGERLVLRESEGDPSRDAYPYASSYQLY